MLQKRKKRGQALVEFALFAVLLMMMLSAVIDLGLLYFAHQGVSGAALEGASYAAMVPNSPLGQAESDLEIERRVHFEGGVNPNLQHRAVFVNLLDLNNDNQIDSTTVDNPMIIITSVANRNAPPSTTDQVCAALRRGRVCDMRVEVRYIFKPEFFLTSIFGLDEVQISARRETTIQTYD